MTGNSALLELLHVPVDFTTCVLVTCFLFFFLFAALVIGWYFYNFPVLLAIVHALRRNVSTRQQSLRQRQRCMSALWVGHRRAAYGLGLRVTKVLLAIGILMFLLSSLAHKK